MAWKLRKDKLPESAAEDESGLADTAVPDEAPTMTAAHGNETPAADAEDSPFVMIPAEDDLLPLSQHGVIATPMFNSTESKPVFVYESASEAPEPTFDAEAPAFDSEAPKFADELPAEGPFAPFIMNEEAQAAPSSKPEPQTIPPAYPTSIGPDEVASGLVHTGGESDLPLVAPFIVDVPPAPAEEPPAIRNLAVRIGNFAAGFVLTKDVTRIGRPDSLLQNYPDVEIELDDAVSRRHAEIRHHDGDYVLADMDSTNGTLLNGEKLVPLREYPLAPGDRIHLGDRTEIIFE